MTYKFLQAVSHDYSLQDLFDILIREEMVDRDAYVAYIGHPPAFALELIDLYTRANAQTRLQLIPLFDEAYYSRIYPAADLHELPALIHYLRAGAAEGKSPHPLISPAYIRHLRPDLFPANDPVLTILRVLRLNLCDASPYFNQAFYLSQGAEPAGSALKHYLATGAAKGFAPNRFFDWEYYSKQLDGLSTDPVGCLLHFAEFGDADGLSPSRQFDVDGYVGAIDGLAADAMPPFMHFMLHGAKTPDVASGYHRHGRESKLPHFGLSAFTEDAVEGLNSYLRTRRAVVQRRRLIVSGFKEVNSLPFQNVDPLPALASLRFPEENEAVVDIIIPFYNEFQLLVECLTAVMRFPPSVSFQITLVDDCSTDRRCALLKEVTGIRYIRNEENSHFLKSANHAFELSNAAFVVLLNSDTQLTAGALDHLLVALQENDGLGIVGPAILYPNGRLQEAGCALRPDGSSDMIGVGEDPEQGRFSYPRLVDYVSGACLMLRRGLITGELFNSKLAPAYCEDAELCLRVRSLGFDVAYVPAARVYHHLSASTGNEATSPKHQMIALNQVKVVEAWGQSLIESNTVQCLAFYLPQFHPIWENDLWWGAGFTEWTNTTKAEPVFAGHNQPQTPTDLGFYDLRVPATMQRQQELADRYGVDGFVVYYYNFGAKRLLEQPVDNILAHPEVNFRFCFCWANESWTKHWNGGERGVLIEQVYDEATLCSVISDAVRAARDARYMRLGSDPIFMVYRPLLIPDVVGFATKVRQGFAEAGFSGVRLLYVESMEMLQKAVSPLSIGFDAAVEFPPQGIGAPVDRKVFNTVNGWDGNLYSYEDTVVNACTRSSGSYLRYPSVFPSWDNTARQPISGTILTSASPGAFQAYVEFKAVEALQSCPPREKLLFINAWNEWAEGAHLEPDRAFGHRWLSALRAGVLNAGYLKAGDDI